MNAAIVSDISVYIGAYYFIITAVSQTEIKQILEDKFNCTISRSEHTFDSLKSVLAVLIL